MTEMSAVPTANVDDPGGRRQKVTTRRDLLSFVRLKPFGRHEFLMHAPPKFFSRIQHSKIL